MPPDLPSTGRCRETECSREAADRSRFPARGESYGTETASLACLKYRPSCVVLINRRRTPSFLAPGYRLLLLVVRRASLAALFGRTAKALIRRTLRGMVFIHMAPLGVQLMIAQAQC